MGNVDIELSKGGAPKEDCGLVFLESSTNFGLSQVILGIRVYPFGPRGLPRAAWRERRL